ncbi:translation initiation factor IF-2-like isoform X3 [Canis lupus familiaris]|uniref:translation initiation factor IF-2-like isoform X3 n=1 Tax=Canis lupus familiaris TaxID=9615 RepID=UPI0018F41B7B|nr:translation initiation factor IF-2-like isoform X3 [Canis lupus familiaris]
MGGLTREARGSAPHAWGEKEWPAERRRQAGARSRREEARGPVTVGPAAPARPRGSAPASASCARPLPAARRPPPPAPARSALPGPPRTELCRYYFRRERSARTRTVTHGRRRRKWSSGRAARRESVVGCGCGAVPREGAPGARPSPALPGPPRPSPPCGGSSPTPGARPFPRTHWARGAEARPLPSPGHASSRGRRGAGPSGRARACSAPRRCPRVRRCPDSSPRRDGRHNLGGRREDLRGKGRTQRDCGPPWDLPPALAGPRGGRLAPTAGAGRGGATSRSCARPRDRSPPGPVCAETASIGCRARGRDSAFSDPLEGRATPAELDRFRHQEPDGRSPPLCARASPRNRILNQPIWNHLVSTYEQITNSTTYVGSSFLFLLKHGTVIRERMSQLVIKMLILLLNRVCFRLRGFPVLLPALRLTPATLLHPGSSPLAAAFHLYNRGEKTCSFSNILRICPIIPLRSTGTASQCLPLGPDDAVERKICSSYLPLCTRTSNKNLLLPTPRREQQPLQLQYAIRNIKMSPFSFKT